MICVQQQDTQLTSSKAFCEKLEDLGCGSSVKPKPEKKILTRRKSQWRMLSNGVEGEDCERSLIKGLKGITNPRSRVGRKSTRNTPCLMMMTPMAMILPSQFLLSFSNCLFFSCN